MNTSASNMDEYIAGFPEETRKLLAQIRDTIRRAAPDAEETISYQMPTFRLNGKNLVHFAGYASHVGFYPVPSGIEKFREELSPYKQGRGSVQFPLNQPLPLDLISAVVTFRVQENQEQASLKKK